MLKEQRKTHSTYFKIDHNIMGTLPQSFLSILSSHSIVTTDLYKCLHHGRVPGTDLRITSAKIPAWSLPQHPLLFRPCPNLLFLLLKPSTWFCWLLHLCWSQSVPISLNSFFLLASRSIYVCEHRQLRVCKNPDQTCFLRITNSNRRKERPGYQKSKPRDLTKKYSVNLSSQRGISGSLGLCIQGGDRSIDSVQSQLKSQQSFMIS